MNQKTLKPISEAKYLSVENAWRYRAIMRVFYIYDQKFKHWLNKEDVYEELRYKDHFEEYTIEMCKQDLESLNQWGNLSAVQDTSKVTTYQQFVNKQYRYQMTEYSIEIERMTIRLENIFIEGGSLEPTLLERIKDELKKMPQVIHLNDKALGGWWSQLTNDFQRLNQNYQDYIRDWNSLKAEELMKTKSFIIYKEKLIEYLRDFIKELQKHAGEIGRIFLDMNEEYIEVLCNRICDYEMEIPRIDMENIKREDVFSNIKGKYNSMEEFFIGGKSRRSEVETVLLMTNEIIRRITRYAVNILELASQYTNRKEEYLKIANLFQETGSLEEAHLLAGNIFGIKGCKHFTGDMDRETESIQSSIYEEKPLKMILSPRVRTFREKMRKSAIKDSSEEKRKMREKVLFEREEEKKILMHYMKTGLLEFEKLEGVSPKVRTTLLKWLVKGIREKGEITVTEHGQKYKLKNPEEKRRCKVVCDDGTLELPAYILEFEEKL